MNKKTLHNVTSVPLNQLAQPAEKNGAVHWLTSKHYIVCSYNYHSRMRRGNVFSRIWMRVYLSVMI